MGQFSTETAAAAEVEANNVIIAHCGVKSIDWVDLYSIGSLFSHTQRNDDEEEEK